MYIPLSDDKHWFVRDNSKKVPWKSETTSKTKFSPRHCLRLDFVSDSILSWTEFYLGLDLSRTEFCLGLHTAVVFRMQSFNIVGKGIPYMVFSDNLDVAQWLIDNGCNIHSVDMYGVSPIRVAAIERNVPAIKLLIKG